MVPNFKRQGCRPLFFENGNVKKENYRNMLIHYALPRFAYLQPDYIFHQDGAPAHYSHLVRIYLDNKRLENWIGRGRPVEWPARSPDLTPRDFFLCVHLKEKLYTTPVGYIEDLKSGIRRDCRCIRSSVLKKVWDNLKLRLNVLENFSGRHIENMIWQ